MSRVAIRQSLSAQPSAPLLLYQGMAFSDADTAADGLSGHGFSHALRTNQGGFSRWRYVVL